MSNFSAGAAPIQFDPSLLDPNGRLKMTTLQTIFDVDFEYSAQNARWESLTTGGANIAQSPTAGGIIVTCPGVANAVAIRQSKVYHRYQPGKATYIATATLLGNPVANVVKRVGIYDNSNGIFMEHSGYNATTGLGNVYAVQRSDSGGRYPLDNRVLQANWNIDTFDGTSSTANPSGILINFNVIQMIIMDFAWYGAGSARIGFLINGKVYWGHQFRTGNNTNNPYNQNGVLAWARTGNLPVRYEIRQPLNPLPSSGVTIYHWGVSVVTEGRYDTQRGFSYAATNGVNLKTITARTPILSLRYYPMGVIQNTSGIVNVGVVSGGTGYAVGNAISMTGNGAAYQGLNSAIAFVSGVGPGGAITSMGIGTIGSYGVLGTSGQPYFSAIYGGTNLTGSGSGAVFSTLPGGQSTAAGFTSNFVNTTISSTVIAGTSIIYVTSNTGIANSTLLNIGFTSSNYPNTGINSGSLNQEFVYAISTAGSTIVNLSAPIAYSHVIGEPVTVPQTLVDTSANYGVGWTANTWAGRHVFMQGLGTVGYIARVVANTPYALYLEDAQLSDSNLGVHTYIPYNIGAGVTYQIGIIQRGQLWLNQLYVYSSAACSFELVYTTNYSLTFNGGLVGYNWVNMNATGAQSSLSQQDTAATAISGGETVYRAYTPGGGSGVQQYDLSAMLPSNNTIYGNQPDIVSVVATPLGTTVAQVSAALVYFEAMA
jgi:hypothetical protein